MPTATAFKLQTSTPDHTLARARAGASASAFADADFWRGIDIRLGAALAADASLGAAVGQIKAGAIFTADIACQVLFPIDLFKLAGVYGRLQAKAALQAYIGAEIALPAGPFYKLIEDRVANRALRELQRVFFEEVIVTANFWASGEVAVEAHGQAILAGSFLTSDRGAGFTYSFDYGYAYLYGGGFTYGANMEIRDPRRLMDQMATTITDVLMTEVESYVGSIGSPANETSYAAVLQLLIPLSTRTLFHLGLTLSDVNAGEVRDRALTIVTEPLFQHARQQLLRALAEIGTLRLADYLRDKHDYLAKQLQSHGAEAAVHLDDLIGTLNRMDKADFGDAEAWFPALKTRFEALSQYVPGPSKEQFENALSLMTCAIEVLRRIENWSTYESGEAARLFDESAVAIGAATVERHVRAELGKAPGSLITFVDLVRFIMDRTNWRLDLQHSVPMRAAALDTVLSLLNAKPETVLTRLSGKDREQVAETLAERLKTLVDDQIVPRIVNKIRNDETAMLIDQMVVPTISALSHSVIPKVLALGGDPNEVRRLRESVSAILFQQIQMFVMNGMDYTVQETMAIIDDFADESKKAIEHAEENSPFYSPFLAVASGEALGREIVMGIIDYSTFTVKWWYDHEYAPLSTAIRSLTSHVALSPDTDFWDVALALSGPATPRFASDIDALSKALLRSVLLTGIASAAELRLLQGLIVLRMPKRFVEMVARAAVEAWHAAQRVAAWIVENIEKLLAKLRELADELIKVADQLLKLCKKLLEFIDHLVDTIIHSIKDAGRAIAKDLTKNVQLPAPVEHLADLVLDLALDAYDASIGSLMDGWHASLKADLKTAGDWIDKARQHTSDPNELRRELRQALGQIVPPDLSIVLAVDIDIPLPLLPPINININIGKIDLPIHKITDAISHVVLGDGSVDACLDAIGAAQQLQAQIQAEQQRVEAQKGAEAGKLAEAKARYDGLRPNGPLGIHIISPRQDSEYSDHAAVSVHVDGVNETFLKATLGMPRRVKVLLNGNEIDCDPDQHPGLWAIDATGVTFNAEIALAQPPPDTRAVAAAAVRQEFGNVRLQYDSRLDRAAGVWNAKLLSAQVEDPRTKTMSTPTALNMPREIQIPSRGAQTRVIDREQQPGDGSLSQLIDAQDSVQITMSARVPMNVALATIPIARPHLSVVPIASDPSGSPMGTPAFKAAQPGFNLLHVIVTDGISDGDGTGQTLDANVEFYMV